MKRSKKKLAYLTAGSLLISAISNVPVMANGLTPDQQAEGVSQNEQLMKVSDETVKSAVTTSGALSATTTPSALKLQYQDKEALVSEFEDGNKDGWAGRGSAKAEIVENGYNGSASCLHVTERTANWHGSSKDFSAIVTKGNTYFVSAWIKYEEGKETESITLTLQNEVESKTDTQYDRVANKTVKKGEWTYFEGTMSIPKDMTSAVLYVEADSTNLEFYVDDITIQGDFGSEEVSADIEYDIPSLKDVYAQYFKMGTAIGNMHLNDVEKELVKKHFNSITCENEMKPESLLDYDATIKYMEEHDGDETHPKISLNSNARKILDFAQENDIPMRGHVLVWHSQTPNWLFTEGYSKESGAPLVSREVMLERLENYIQTVFETLEEEYPDVDFYAFDVVNEAIDPGTENGLRRPATVAGTTGDDNNNESQGKSMWMTVIGDDFIEKAYAYARKYAPEGVKLAYNDYNECEPAKSEIMYNLCKKIAEQGNLDVIGMQGHHNMSTPSVKQFEAALRKYGSLGLKIEITELDIGQTDSSERGMLEQAYRYKEFFETMKRVEDEGAADIDAVVLWGVKDDESWRSQNSPLLFDSNYHAKKAYWGIVDPSQLEVMQKETKSFFTTNENYEQALKVQSGNQLVTVADKELGKFKVACSNDKVYIKVEAADEYRTQEGELTLWVNGQKLTGKLTGEKIFTIPADKVLDEGGEVSFDISLAYGEERATWNNTYYKGGENDQLGVVNVSKMPKIATAIKGTPTIGDEIDSIWEKAETIDVDQFSVGHDGATAKAKVMWDEDNIYVLMEVKDAVLSKASSDNYQQDSVEIFIDEDNAKSTSYEEGDVQYRVNFENEQSINGTTIPERFITATHKVEGGYIVEATLPTLMGGFRDKQILGFDLQINDDADGDGKRDNVTNWNDLSGNGWSSTAGYGFLQLKDQAAVDVDIEYNIPSLKDVYAQYFKMGTAIGNMHLNDIEKELVKKHFNSITCENEMKPESLLDYDATIKYMEENNGDQTHPKISLNSNARKILDFAQENNISMRGHVLVWHSQTPNWLFTENYSKESGAPIVSREVMLQRMENYIQTVFETLQEEYPDVDFYAFDVVNEAIDPGTENGLRRPATVAGTTGDDNNNESQGKSMWMTTIGDDFIEKAFAYARKYAPEGVQLAYNDYNECDPAKVEIMYNLCKKIKEQGNIDVIGMQGHHNMSTPSVKQFEAALRKYGSLGLKIEITELDIGQTDSAERGMLEQAYRYKEFFDTMKRVEDEGAADIDAVVLWGVKDDESWRSQNSPLLFDSDYHAKKAYWGIVDPSQLEVLQKETKSYFTTNENYEQAIKVQAGNQLATAADKELGKFKVACSNDKVYVKVEAADTYRTQEGDITLWINGQKVTDKLTGEKTFIIPANKELTEGSEVSFDISLAYGNERATWNNTYYKGGENNQFGNVNISKMPKVATAIKGTPTIDGKIDSIWQKAEAVEVDQFSAGKDGATAKAKVMWDKDNVYVLMEVKDPILSKASSDTYQQDSIELFIDEDNAKSTSYEEGDVQYRVNFDNEQSINGTTIPERFITATQKVEGGYIVEAALPTLMGGFVEKQILGFDLQVNDDANGNGKRDNVANWNDLTGGGWSSTAAYGFLQLKDAAVIDSSSSDDDDTPSTPSTPSSSNSSSNSAATTEKTVDETILGMLKDNQNADVKLSMDKELMLSAGTVQALANSKGNLVVNNNKVSLSLAPEFFKNNISNDKAVELSTSMMKSDEYDKLDKQLGGSSLGKLGDINLIREVAVKEDQKDVTFKEPMKMTFDLTGVNVKDANKLAVVKYEQDKEGKWQAVKLGGTYDAKNHSLTCYISQNGIYGVAEPDSLLTLYLTVGSKEIKINNNSKMCDVAPQIINNSTMVPLRFIAENLGVEVKWDSKTKQITLISNDQTIQMKLGEKVPGFDVAPVVENGRTLVPLRYISEELGANVTWIPSVKGIEITK